MTGEEVPPVQVLAQLHVMAKVQKVAAMMVMMTDARAAGMAAVAAAGGCFT